MLRAWLRLFPVIILSFILCEKVVASVHISAASKNEVQAKIKSDRQPLNISAETNANFSSLTDTRPPLTIGHLPQFFNINALFSQMIGILRGYYSTSLLITKCQFLFPFHVFW
jgi:hypothetical protein